MSSRAFGSGPAGHTRRRVCFCGADDYARPGLVTDRVQAVGQGAGGGSAGPAEVLYVFLAATTAAWTWSGSTPDTLSGGCRRRTRLASTVAGSASSAQV